MRTLMVLTALSFTKGVPGRRWGKLWWPARGPHLIRFALCVSVIGVLFFLTSGTSSAHIDSLVPNQWTAGGPTFTLRILGTDFVDTGDDDSDTRRVFFDGTRVETTLISDREMRAMIPANLLVSPHVARVALGGFNSLEFIINPPPTITTESPLPNGAVRLLYSQRLKFAGGIQTETPTWSGDSLPPGLSLGRFEHDGLLSGTPTTPGTFGPFPVRVRDAAGVMATKSYTVTIIELPPPCPPSTISISAESKFFNEDGAAFTLAVTAPSGCSWSAESSSPWITVYEGAFGIGSGEVKYDVDENLNSWRQGYITINGGAAVHHVFQDGPCLLDIICDAIKSDGCNDIIGPSRNFRDEVLAETPRGRRYTKLYYQFSTEAVQIIMLNPMLILRSRDMLERYMPVLQSMIKHEQVTLTQRDIEDIDSFLSSFAQKASSEWRDTLNGLREDLRDPQVQTEFRITITDGPKRELPAKGAVQTVKQTGILIAPIGLLLFCSYAVRRRRKKTRGVEAADLEALRTRAQILLSAFTDINRRLDRKGSYKELRK